MKTEIYFDAHENTVRATVNRFGKKLKFDNGGHRIGIICGEIEAVYYNTVCPDQFAAECFGCLKAVEFAKEQGLKSVTLRNDRITSFQATTKRGYKGTTYLWLAEKMAREEGIEVDFEYVQSEENLADKVSRREGAEQGIQKKKQEAAPAPIPAPAPATASVISALVGECQSRFLGKQTTRADVRAAFPSLTSKQIDSLMGKALYGRETA